MFSSTMLYSLPENQIIFGFEQVYASDSELSKSANISFGTKLSSELFNSEDIKQSSWSISLDDDVIMSGKGINLFDYVFDRPGAYEIAFQHDHSVGHNTNSCNHYSMPESFAVNVSAVRIEFLGEQMTFSAPLVGGKSMDGVVMNTPIIVHTYSNERELVAMPVIARSYGIETSLEGRMIAPIEKLAPGQQVLSYVLTGEATPETYIGFDFIDNNGNVFPCGITTIIK